MPQFMGTRVFDKHALIACNNMAQVQNYNRICDPQYLEALPDEFFAPFITLLHEHKTGQPCDPHVRCVFKHGDDHFTIDVEMGCWELLPTFEETMAAIEKIKTERPPETVA